MIIWGICINSIGDMKITVIFFWWSSLWFIVICGWHWKRKEITKAQFCKIMCMFIILTVVMVSVVYYIYVKSHQIVHFKYVQCWGNKEPCQQKDPHIETENTSIENAIRLQTCRYFMRWYNLDNISHFLSSKVEERTMETSLISWEMNEPCGIFLSSSQEIPELISEVGE